MSSFQVTTRAAGSRSPVLLSRPRGPPAGELTAISDWGFLFPILFAVLFGRFDGLPVANADLRQKFCSAFCFPFCSVASRGESTQVKTYGDGDFLVTLSSTLSQTLSVFDVVPSANQGLRRGKPFPKPFLKPFQPNGDNSP